MKIFTYILKNTIVTNDIYILIVFILVGDFYPKMCSGTV